MNDSNKSEHNAESMCREQVGEPPGYWHFHACGRKPKWVVAVARIGGGGGFAERPVCGIHVKWYQRNGKVLRQIDRLVHD